MRTFVMGDIHGANRALQQCLERSGFNPINDHLICLGDVCDGWPETRQAINTLLTLTHLTYLLGNHDYWTLQWMSHGLEENAWLDQGGKATIASYEGIPDPAHARFLADAPLYYEYENRFFVHAGFETDRPVAEQEAEVLLWDRTLARLALVHYYGGNYFPITHYDEVYIGHTPTPFGQPVLGGGVWLMDTGAGWAGRLTMMDIHTKEIFASDPVPSLYPGVPPRQRKQPSA